jgi:D-lyxose ketol-isomerase
MKRADVERARRRALDMLGRARIEVRPEEAAVLEVSDFGLGALEAIGIQILVYVNTDRYCAKEIVLTPRQICPEHRHPPLGAPNPGKQETFRCRAGEVYLYVPGAPSVAPRARVPEKFRPGFAVWHEIVLRPGDQYTLTPDTLHWFQAGDEGAVVSEFSSTSDDASDVFTLEAVERLPRIED